MGVRIDPNKRFERQRQQVRQEEQARNQQVQEAIRRKFAAQGLSGAGAEVKSIQQTAGESAKRADVRLGEIESAREQDIIRQQEIEEARKFARGEREAGQSFSATQAELQRKFATGERLSSQDFANLQAQLQREFATGERVAGQEFSAEQSALAREMQQSQFEESLGFQKKQLKEQIKQFEKQHKLALEQFDLIKSLAGSSKRLRSRLLILP